MAKRRFKNKKARYVAIGAAITTSAAVATVLLPSANAADETTHNVVIIGSTIPAGTGSVTIEKAGGPAGECITKLQPGVDKDTQLKVSPGDLILYQLARDAACGRDRGEGYLVTVPENISTQNLWLPVKF